MKFLIAVPCKPDQARYVDFFQMMFKLEIPVGCKIEYELFPSWFPHDGRNNAVKKALKEGFDYILFLDDDQVVPPYMLKQLWSHRVNIVVCNLLNRLPPFHPYLFDSTDEKGRGHGLELEQEPQLIEIAACGAGGLLINTDIFADWKEPFGIDQDLKTDDLFFCREARKRGHKIYCDLKCPSGHMIKASVWPVYENGKWETKIVIMDTIAISVPAAKRNEEGVMAI